jgi:hypothetical protein
MDAGACCRFDSATTIAIDEGSWATARNDTGRYALGKPPRLQKRRGGHVVGVVVGSEVNTYWRILGAKYRKTVSVDEWR